MRDAAEEAIVAERFMGCPWVAQLLDAFACSKPKLGWCLVYEFHGTSLANVLSEGPLAVRVVRDVFSDVLKGIQCVHVAGFIAPEHFCVQRWPRATPEWPRASLVGSRGRPRECR